MNLLGGNNGRKGIITTNTNTHDYTPEDDKTNKRGGRRTGSQGLGKSRKDDDNKLQTIHPLTTDNIGQHTKSKLSNNSTSRSRKLDSVIRASSKLSLARIIHNTQHDGQHGHAEDIVGVSKETNTSNDTGADMVPSERSLVDLGEGKTTTLIGVGDVSKVVVKVVEGIVAAACLGDGTRSGSHFWKNYLKNDMKNRTGLSFAYVYLERVPSGTFTREIILAAKNKPR